MPRVSSGGGADQHPGNDYMVNLTTGTIQRQSNSLLQALMRAADFAGPMNWHDAVILSHDKQGRADIASASPTSTSGLQAAATGGDTSLFGPLSQIGAFFAALTQPNTWIRVGEVVAGLILLYVGLNALTKDTAAGQAVHRATEGAKKVVEVMPK